MTRDSKKFGEELDRLLRVRGISKKNFAEEIGTSAAYVSAVVGGKKNVSPATVTSFGEHLGVDQKDLQKLHRAAALDMGFDLGLPDDFDD